MIKAIFAFIKHLIASKKWWLVPIIVLLMLFGGLIIYSQGAAVAPFVYTFF
jgi:hypothetical protein